MLTKNDFSIVKSSCWFHNKSVYLIETKEGCLRKPYMHQYQLLDWEFGSQKEAQNFINVVCKCNFPNLAALKKFLSPQMFYFTFNNGHHYMALNISAFIKKFQNNQKKANIISTIQKVFAA